MDITENIRRGMVEAINTCPKSREQLEEEYGDVWDTIELQEDFIVKGFLAPFISVTRKKDNAEGALCFQHLPRFYFGFIAS